MNNQRLFDLVRYQRSELHHASLITDEEYAELAMAGSQSARRLEDYDQVRAKITFLERELAEKTEAAREFASANAVLGDSLTKVVKQKNGLLSLVQRLAAQEEPLLSAPIGTVDIPDDLWAIIQEARKIVEGGKS